MEDAWNAAIANVSYEQIAEKLSSDGYSRQVDVIRQIIKMEQADDSR